MLTVQNLRHSFGDTPVLRGIDLDIAEGEVIAVMGTSGGGKTTLLKCVAGLIEPDEGEITLEGKDIIADPEWAHENMGMVFQSAALFDYLNVRDNILFGAKRKKKLSREDQDELVNGLLEHLGLEGAAEKLPGELSGGMRKRVGLARALALSPKVLLYDEPTSGLDPVTAYSIDNLIVDTRNRLGVTSLVVSHDVTSVFRVATRIAFLEEGRLVFIGSAGEFRKSRASAIQELIEKAKSETPLVQEAE